MRVCNGRSALYGDAGLFCSSHWLLPCINPRGNCDGWGGGVWGVSVQGECARGEELHMGMGGCCAAPIGCCFAPYGWWHKFSRERWPGVGVGGCECARRVCRRVCKVRSALYGDGGLFCSSHWLLSCTNPRGNGDGLGGRGGECARGVCKESVQGECAR